MKYLSGYSQNQIFAIGANIKKLRSSKGISQLDLAMNAGIAPGTIVNLEKQLPRNPHWTTLERVAKALGTHINLLINFNF